MQPMTAFLMCASAIRRIPCRNLIYIRLHIVTEFLSAQRTAEYAHDVGLEVILGRPSVLEDLFLIGGNQNICLADLRCDEIF